MPGGMTGGQAGKYKNMYYNDPNDPSQQQPSDPNAQPGQPYRPSDPNAQPGQPSDPNAQPYRPQNAQPGQPYRPQNTQPGYPYHPHNTQPGYPPMTNVPPSSGSGAPTWYQPNTPMPQQHVPQGGLPQRPTRSKGRTVAISALTLLLAIVFVVGLFSGWTFARSNGANATVASSTSPSTTVSTSLDQSALEASIAKVSPAVVEVVGQVTQGTALGSGIIVDKNGDVITNNHVVSGTSGLRIVLSDGRSVSAQVIGTAPANDLAVLRIQPYAGMTVATFGNSSQLTVGEEVLAIGNPLGYSGTVTSGVVSALNRSAQESRTVNLSGLIQTSAPINPGNSGGALINVQGQVVGVPTLSAVNSENNTPANGIGFAIPSSQVQATLTQIVG